MNKHNVPQNFLIENKDIIKKKKYKTINTEKSSSRTAIS